MPVNNSPSHTSPVSNHSDQSPVSEPGSPQWRFINSAFNRILGSIERSGRQEQDMYPITPYSGRVVLEEGASSHVPRLSPPSRESGSAGSRGQNLNPITPNSGYLPDEGGLSNVSSASSSPGPMFFLTPVAEILNLEGPFYQRLEDWQNTSEGLLSTRNNRQQAAEIIRSRYQSGGQSLDLSGIDLGSLPDIFEDIPSVTTIGVIRCQLSSLPPSFYQMHSLEKLYLGDNRLTSLPSQLGNFFRLVELDLHSNRLANLPADLFESMWSLGYLDLSNNRLTTLPESIIGSPLIRHLDLSDNRFSEIPEVIWQLPPGCAVDLSNNPLSLGARLSLEEAGVGERFTIPEPHGPSFAGELEPEQLPSLRESLAKWLPEGVHLPSLAGADQENFADSFNSWLNRLNETNEFSNEESRPFFLERLKTLFEQMDADKELLKACFICAEDAIRECEDRIALGLRDMELAAINRDAELGRLKEGELIQLGQGMHRLQLLEQVARETNQAQMAPRHVRFMEKAADALWNLAELPPSIIPPLTSPTPAALAIHAQMALERTEQAARNLMDSTLPTRNFSHENFSTDDGVAGLTAFLSERTDHIGNLLELIDTHLQPEVFLPHPDEIINEEVEVFLAYQVELKDELQLPVKIQGMNHATVANLTSEDLGSAVRTVTENSRDLTQQHLFLSQWMPLQKHLERSHKDEFEKIIEPYSDTIESLGLGPQGNKTEGEWKAQVDQTAKKRLEAIEGFHQRHTASVIGYAPSTSNAPQQ